MKIRFLCALVLLAVFIAQPARADARYEFAAKTLVRLQVRAASDSGVDQRIKLTVRDAVRAEAVPLAARAKDADEAFALLEESKARIQRAAQKAARGAGFAGEVRVETGRMRFPLRLYGNVLVPPGEYRALRVTLGEGEGRNWWCVVYPDLCATDAAGAEALREGRPIRFYSSLMRLIRQWFGGDGQ